MAIYTDPTFGSGRISLRPLEYVSGSKTFGFYRARASSGACVAVTATGELLSFRWTATTANAILLRLTATANVTADITPAAASPNYDLEAVIARSYSVTDTGGTAVTPGAFQMGRATMGNSLVSDIRVATTAKLTAGTRTLDTFGFGFANLRMMGGLSTNVGACSVPVDLYAWDDPREYPITFAQNEGFVVRAQSAGNTGGSVRYTFTVSWAEVPASTSF